MRTFPVLFFLAACSSQPAMHGGETADDRQLLNEAEDMLAANSVGTDTVTANESTTP